METNRLRARTVAQIEPGDIEKVAGHLVTRSYEDPWWDEARGEAMTTERVSLYGLPVVTGRRKPVDQVDPARARAMFLRHALVDGDWDGARHAFVRANQEQVADVVALEERTRRDLLVGDDELVAFFDARVPDDITSARRFGTWWAKAQRAEPDRLTYRPADLIDPAAGVPDLADFPEAWTLGEARLPLTYVLDPTSDLDGVVVDVPLPLLDAVERAGLEWQVPGRRLELVTALVRTLPKDLRRRHTPAGGGRRRGAAPRIGPDDGPLLDVLAARADRARRPGGRAPPPRSGRGARPPARHVPRRRRRRSPAGVEQGPGRSPTPAGRAGAGGAGHRLTGRRGARRDRHGRSARSRRPSRSPTPGMPFTGFPALIDEGDAVGLRVLPTEPEARAAMWGGTRRLLLLQLGSPMRTLDRALPERREARPHRVRPAVGGRRLPRQRGRRGRPAAGGARRPGARRRSRSRRSAPRCGPGSPAPRPASWSSWPTPSATPPPSTARWPRC